VDFSNESRNVQIGIYLRTLREEQNLTPVQLSKLSQVPTVHIEAIEAGRFSRYDDFFYLKLYLKKYTQALDVDLEQLYTYATQQKELELTVNPESEKVLTGMQADIATVIPKKEKVSKSAPPKTVIQTKGVAVTNTKGKFGRFLVALFLVLIIGVIIAVVLIALRNGNGGDDGDTFVPPPIMIDPPPGLNGEDYYEYSEPDTHEPEPEPTPEDFTTVYREGYAGTIQTFIITTSLEEIVLRIEHTGPNWIDIDNGTHSDTFEHTFAATNSTFTFRIGAINNVEAIFINDMEVPIITENLNGPQTFIFNILSTSDNIPDYDYENTDTE